MLLRMAGQGKRELEDEKKGLRKCGDRMAFMPRAMGDNNSQGWKMRVPAISTFLL